MTGPTSPAAVDGRPLDRSTAAGPAAPVRMVHLGLGSFFRAHQAWYTAHAPDAADWGFAAFTGRSAALSTVLAGQNGLYTLLTKAADGDSVEVLASISRTHPGADTAALLGYLADPAVTVMTLTVTEAGYRLGADGRLDLSDPDVIADLDTVRDILRRKPSDVARSAPALRTVPARVAAGLLVRRAAGAGPLSVVSCDNLPHNGRITAQVVTDFALQVDAAAPEWISGNIGFVTTMVDRITPTTAPADMHSAAQLSGYADQAPVVTEPFSEWVLSGTFTAARPDWAAAGAAFVPDIAPFEQRKLWILNGGHSLLAYLGGARGHTTIADTMDDQWCRRWLTTWWDEATDHLDLPRPDVLAYRDAVLTRFTNPAIRHLLSQIGTDGSQKLPIRILPVLRRRRANGELPPAAVLAIAGWIHHVRDSGSAVKDVAAGRLQQAALGPVEMATAALLRVLDENLAGDTELVAAIVQAVGTLADR